MNHLYYGDNLQILREHIKDESVDLVYLDPPFNSQATYNVLFKAPSGEQSAAQIEAFEDTWHWNDTAEQAFDEVMHSGSVPLVQKFEIFQGVEVVTHSMHIERFDYVVVVRRSLYLLSMPLAEELEKLIDSSTTERPIVRWLKEKENAWILPLAVKMFPLGKYALPEFHFGTDYRADFVVMGPFSGGFDIQFMEMEPPNAKLFTGAGKPAERFAGALAQVRDWKIYVDKNRDTVVKELAKSAEKEALLWTQWTKNSKSPSVFSPALSPLNRYHPRAGFNWDYHIVIGRRTSLSEEQLEKKAAFHNTDSVEVMTYDRLIDAAKAWDTDKGEHVEFHTPWRNQREGLCSEDLVPNLRNTFRTLRK